MIVVNCDLVGKEFFPILDKPFFLVVGYEHANSFRMGLDMFEQTYSSVF